MYYTFLKFSQNVILAKVFHSLKILFKIKNLQIIISITYFCASSSQFYVQNFKLYLRKYQLYVLNIHFMGKGHLIYF